MDAMMQLDPRPNVIIEEGEDIRPYLLLEQLDKAGIEHYNTWEDEDGNRHVEVTYRKDV